MDKQQLRQQIRTMMCKMTDQQRSEASQKACNALINTPEFQNASTVMAFLSMPHEIDTTSLILYAWRHSKTIVVPKISWQQRHMIPVRITSLEAGIATEIGGLRNPVIGVPVPMDDIDLIVTPGLAFDTAGNRLGRGGSYYDRFFVHKDLKAVKCGLAFAGQLVPAVPAFQHDQPIDMLVTDEKVMYFKQK
ncbi:MAG: 5-formyltetrahydrofolate cyclo-ligase [Phycisphaerae bacterium]|jgi:5-formyltetrahydrofolate cyclo-ligase